MRAAKLELSHLLRLDFGNATVNIRDQYRENFKSFLHMFYLLFFCCNYNISIIAYGYCNVNKLHEEKDNFFTKTGFLVFPIDFFRDFVYNKRDNYRGTYETFG